jgi:ABC-type phosphate/phosphonate transport system substrate-binding protein
MESMLSPRFSKILHNRFSKVQQKKILRLSIFGFFLLNISVLISSANAEYILSAPPRENAKLSEKNYGPLAESLSKVIGDKVVYKKPNGWLDYAKNMRKGKYDIVFDGPHFAAWRLKHLHQIPVAVLPGTLQYLLIANVNDNEINICGMVSPHLGTSLVYELFDNPVLQPVIQEVKGGVQEVYKAYKKGICRAAILRTVDFDRLPMEEKIKVKIVAKTKALPNQTITISPSLKKNAKKIANFLVSKEGAIAAKGVLKRYSKESPYFIRAPSLARYRGIEDLLEGVVWGW